MQTEMESRERRGKFPSSIPCYIFVFVALRLYQGHAIGEVFNTKTAIIFSLSAVWWLYQVFRWLRDRRAEKECIQGEKDEE